VLLTSMIDATDLVYLLLTAGVACVLYGCTGAWWAEL